jgi:hypothetical protein
MVEYPDYWLCTCGHRKDEHNWKIPKNNRGTMYGACIVLKKSLNKHYADGCCDFSALDNLTLIEQLAKQKELIK